MGTGSTFAFMLPIVSATTLQPEIVSVLPATDGKLPGSVVMVLTEGGGSTVQLSTYLTQRGFELRICRVDHETEWLAQVTSQAPAALILDEQLAANQGWAIAGILKRQPSTESIPVFAFALDAERDQGELLELNYLHKRIQPE